MYLAFRSNQLKGRTECSVKFCGGVSGYWQSTAPRRAILCKCRYDDVAARAHGVLDSSDVDITLGRGSKKVKDRAVVPDVECLPRQIYFEDVALQPRNRVRSDLSQSGSCTIERSSRQVQNSDVTVTSSDECIDQRGITTAYVDNPCALWQSCAADKLQRSERVLLVPTQSC
jgi:hypothetical protein